jgi:putative flippase GtrA
VSGTVQTLLKHRALLFAGVGVINTAMDFVILNALRVLTHTTSDETSKLIALNIISAASVAVFSFFMNRRFVFKSSDTSRMMIVPFMIITLSSIFIVQSIIISITLKAFDPFASWLYYVFYGSSIPLVKNFSQNFYDANLAKIAATVGSMIWNYLLYKRFVFSADTTRK